MQETVTIILVNPEGKLLLQLRDDKPEIMCPNHWTTPGGFVEEGESHKDTITREIQEELEINIIPELLTRHETCMNHDESVFLSHLDTLKDEIPINEGQKAKFFTIKEIRTLDKVCCDAIEAIEAYERSLN